MMTLKHLPALLFVFLIIVVTNCEVVEPENDSQKNPTIDLESDTIRSVDGMVELIIPFGAFSEPPTITIKNVTEKYIDSFNIDVGPLFEINSPEEPLKPVRIKFNLREFSEENKHATICEFSSKSGYLKCEETTYNFTNNYVSTLLSHFSTYTIFFPKPLDPDNYNTVMIKNFPSRTPLDCGSSEVPPGMDIKNDIVLAFKQWEALFDKDIFVYRNDLSTNTIDVGGYANIEVVFLTSDECMAQYELGLLSKDPLAGGDASAVMLRDKDTGDKVIVCNSYKYWSTLNQYALGCSRGDLIYGTILHEVGHIFGLGHANIDDEVPPVMENGGSLNYPYALRPYDLALLGERYPEYNITSSMAAKFMIGDASVQSVYIGDPIATKPLVLVADYEGNGIDGIPILFRDIASPLTNGEIINPVVRTDHGGVARLDDWILPNKAGRYQIESLLYLDEVTTWKHTVDVEEPPFTKTTFIDPRDNTEYQKVQIGQQEWMAENLKYLPEVSEPDLPMSLESQLYFVYDYSGTSITEAKGRQNYDKYGVLYSWEAAKNACPDGWHLPSDEEWKILEIHLGMDAKVLDLFASRGTDQGEKLKASYGWFWEEGKEFSEGTNEAGFTGLPAGLYNDDFNAIGRLAHFWTSAQVDDEYAIYRGLQINVDQVVRHVHYKAESISVRCVKD